MPWQDKVIETPEDKVITEPGDELDGGVAYNRNPDPKKNPKDSGSWFEDY